MAARVGTGPTKNIFNTPCPPSSCLQGKQEKNLQLPLLIKVKCCLAHFYNLFATFQVCPSWKQMCACHGKAFCTSRLSLQYVIDQI